jgi:hypothetical protein
LQLLVWAFFKSSDKASLACLKWTMYGWEQLKLQNSILDSLLPVHHGSLLSCTKGIITKRPRAERRGTLIVMAKTSIRKNKMHHWLYSSTGPPSWLTLKDLANDNAEQLWSNESNHGAKIWSSMLLENSTIKHNGTFQWAYSSTCDFM